MTESSPRRRLADAMDQRRVELRLQWDEVARRARMSPANLRRLRNDETARLSPMRIADLETALRWEPGTVEAIMSDTREQFEVEVREFAHTPGRVFFTVPPDLPEEDRQAIVHWAEEWAQRLSKRQKGTDPEDPLDLDLP